ncbi:hypothetical protein [Simkania sp.]|uniref:hypothetical protein n=1 Tax=Simkania sp. TaxID=34094 RepID=UPI003B525489
MTTTIQPTHGGTIHGLHSFYQGDDRVVDAKKAWDKVNDPWLQGFVFRSYDSTKMKVWKFAKSFFTLGLAPYIALIHDLIVFDDPKKVEKSKRCFEALTTSGLGIHRDLVESEMKMTLLDRILRRDLQETDLTRLLSRVYKGFDGDPKKTAFFLRTIGQGPGVRLKNRYPVPTGHYLSTNPLQQDKVHIDESEKTIRVSYHYILQRPPIGLEPQTKTYHVKLTADFDFNSDKIDYSFETSDPVEDQKALEVRTDNDRLLSDDEFDIT